MCVTYVFHGLKRLGVCRCLVLFTLLRRPQHLFRGELEGDQVVFQTVFRAHSLSGVVTRKGDGRSAAEGEG